MTQEKLNQKQKIEIIRDKVIMEMGVDQYEMFTDTFNRILLTLPFESKESSIIGIWRVLRKEIPNVFSEYPKLTEEQKRILTVKSTAFEKPKSNAIRKRGNYQSWSLEEKELMLQFIIENKEKTFIEIFALAEDIFDRSKEAMRGYWTTVLRKSYKNILSDPEDIAVIDSKILLVERKTINGKERKEDKTMNTEIEEFKPLNNHPTKEKTIPQNTTKHQSHQIEVTPKYESDFVFRQINENEFEVVKGIVTIDKEFVQNKLKTNSKVTVLTSNNGVLAKNFL